MVGGLGGCGGDLRRGLGAGAGAEPAPDRERPGGAALPRGPGGTGVVDPAVVPGRLGAGRGAEVFVCENPTVLEAAADRHGAASRPLVCTFGLPSQAAWELLLGLGDVRCHVRADGDVVGWRIVNQLRDRLPGAFTWRMPEGCTAYEEELLEDLLSDLGS
ncbi:DUF2399 domain-containing protein [Arachnia propionica]|uniref:DUF2399 domain-containing protein n=1 Tax=Arachnia propionica TaxID=1750 RepID=UPI0030CAB682